MNITKYLLFSSFPKILLLEAIIICKETNYTDIGGGALMMTSLEDDYALGLGDALHKKKWGVGVGGGGGREGL